MRSCWARSGPRFMPGTRPLREREPLLRNGRFAADVLVLGAFAGGRKPVDVGLEPFLDARQLALQRAMQGRFPEAVSLCPHSFFWLLHGRTLYRTGRYSAALEALQKAYHGAAEAGYAHIMMESRAFTGNCYSDMGDFSRMMEHYAVAGRLAEALGAAETQEVIRYNMAATQLTLGHAGRPTTIIPAESSIPRCRCISWPSPARRWGSGRRRGPRWTRRRMR